MNLRLAEFEEYLKTRLNGYGVLCLSTKNDDILMWSHYADSHKGFCLVFDRQVLSRQFFCESIKYEDDYPVTRNYIRQPLDFNPLLLSKSKCWQYEDEVRLVVPPELIDEESDHRLVSMPANCLVGVIWGCQITEEDKGIIKDVVAQPQYKQVRFYTARKAVNSYSLIVEPEAKIKYWDHLYPLPFGVGTSFQVTFPQHPLTPPEVLTKYERMSSPGDFVVWGAGKYCGFKVDQYEVVWTPEEIRGARLSFLKNNERQSDLVILYGGKQQPIFRIYKLDESYLNHFVKRWLRLFVAAMVKNFGVVSEITFNYPEHYLRTR